MNHQVREQHLQASLAQRKDWLFAPRDARATEQLDAEYGHGVSPVLYCVLRYITRWETTGPVGSWRFPCRTIRRVTSAHTLSDVNLPSLLELKMHDP
jgi:hypothetical protein